MDVKFVKLVSGDTVIGTYNEIKNVLEDVALIQVVPGSAGIQIAILPFGFPFEEKIGGEISMDKVLFEYSNVPEDLKSKYFEAKSNIKMQQFSLWLCKRRFVSLLVAWRDRSGCIFVIF